MPLFRRNTNAPVTGIRHRRLIDELTATTALLTDGRALETAIAARFRDLVDCDAVLYAKYDRDNHRYIATSPGQSAPVVLSADGHLVRWLATNETHLDVPDDQGVFAYLTADERAALEAAKVRCCLPLATGGGVIGLLLFIDARVRWRVPAADAAFLLACGRQVALACDAADRHHAEHERLRTMRRAEQLMVAGHMAAIVAHEVKNPLGSIRSTVQFVLKSSSPWEEKQQLLRDTLNEVDRIDQIVSGMLSLSRPRDLELVDVDVADLARESLRMIQPYADSQRIVMHADLSEPVAVVGDRRELRQVLMNLLLNACQATADGGSITVTSELAIDERATTGPSRWGVLGIADTGHGIPLELMDKVFDPFFTTKTTGTGLGLPVCLEIVTRHGGRLDLTCPAHGGTVASVRLPLKAN